MKWMQGRRTNAAASVVLALLIAGIAGCPDGMIPLPGDNTGGTGQQNPRPPEPPGVQPDSSGGTNTPPLVTFQWPTAPLSIQNGTIVNIQWTVQDPEDNARVAIIVRDEFGAESVLASGVPATKPQSSHSLSWNTAPFPTGTYEIIAQATDDVNDPQRVPAPGKVTIVPRPPIVLPPPPPPPPNGAPSLSFKAPAFDVIVEQGGMTTVSWRTFDAEEGLDLLVVVDPDEEDNGNEIILVDTFVPQSNEVVNDSVVWTVDVEPGSYNVRGMVDDLTGLPNHQVKAQATGQIIVIPPGSGSENTPPAVTAVLPDLDRGVSNGEFVGVRVAYSNFEGDEQLTLTLVLDKDNNPNNDDVTDPQDPGIIIVDERAIDPLVLDVDGDGFLDPIEFDFLPLDNTPIGDCLADTYVPGDVFTGWINGLAIPFNPDFGGPCAFDLNDDGIFPDFVGALSFLWHVDTSVVPVRNETDQFGNPLPYYIRVIVDDGTTKISSYASGRILVQANASGTVDLVKTGGTVSGATFRGHADGDYLGSAAVSLGSPLDFTFGTFADEFALVARFGSPRNRGNVGAAYYFLGQPSTPTLGRYAGTINITSAGAPQTFALMFGANVPQGATAPPATLQDADHPSAKTAGITSIFTVPDANGDGLPELVFGMPFISGIHDGVDTDPADCAGAAGCAPGCPYPDPFPKNVSDTMDCFHPFADALGDAETLFGPPIDQGYVFLSEGNTTTGHLGQLAEFGGVEFVDIRHIGQFGAGADPLDDEGLATGIITPTTAGARYRGGWFTTNLSLADDLDSTNEFGRTVCAIAGLHNTGDQTLPDLVVSAPGQDGQRGRVYMFVARDWVNSGIGSDTQQDAGDISFPQITGGGDCSTCLGVVRTMNLTSFPVLTIDGAAPNDRLGQAMPAGDFNQDNIPDLICGSPRADVGGKPNAGKVYLLFNQEGGFGNNIELSTTLDNDPNNDIPRLELRGLSAEDHFGDLQMECGDFDNDGRTDVIIAAPDYDDVGGVGEDAGFVGVVFSKPNASTQILTVDKIGKPELRGIRFIGSNAGDRAGLSVAGAGDFDSDGFADILIAAPNEVRVVDGVSRRGVAYLIYGSATLDAPDDRPEPVYKLSEVGTEALPGIVFISPFEQDSGDGDSSPDEAPLETVAAVGDVDGDGFDDIMIGAPKADKLEANDPDQRQFNVGNAYLIYGSDEGRE